PAPLWSVFGCLLVRTTQNLSLDAANRGKHSLINRPGALQAIGLKGPRILLGARGLRSNVSSWLGPPKSIKKITDLALAGCDLTVASACNSRGSDSPNSPAPPA